MNLATAVLEPDDLELTSAGGLFEFVDGTPVEKEMGAVSDRVGVRLLRRLDEFCDRHALGPVFGGQTGYRCFPHEPKRVRKPDVSFVAVGRLPGGTIPKGDFRIRPDLAVEVVSPNDLCDELDVKLADYRAAGIPLVWVLGPATKTVQVWHADLTGRWLLETDTLSGENVIPGFTCPVADLFV